MPKLASLQAVRAAAALCVLLFHAQSIFLLQTGSVVFGGLFRNGDKGVDLFFVLSGFIMVYVHWHDLGRPERYAAYLYSRITRIYPLMWVMCLLALAVYAAGFNHAKAYKLGALALTQSVLLLPQNEPALVNVTWTLKYEIGFYLLFGLTLLNRRLGTGLIMLWQAAIVVLWLVQADTSSLWAFYLRPIGLEFGFGIAVALAFIATRNQSRASATAVGAAALLVGLAWFGTCFLAPGAPERAFTFGPASALIIAGCCFLERSGHLRVPRFAVRAGDASYAIYLVHYSAINLMVTVLVKTHLAAPGTLLALAVAGIALGIGLVFYQLADRPLGQLAGRLRPRIIRNAAAATS